MSNPNTPVIVGVAQLKNRISDLDETIEPVEMMLAASRQAEDDAGVKLLDKVQSVRVIRGLWPYENPARYIAESIGASNAQTLGTLFGGNYNQVVVNATAASILAGELDLALITGAEIGYSAAKARKNQTRVKLRETPGSYDELFGKNQKPEHHDFELARGIRSAIQVYPIYENAIRYQRRETIEEHSIRVSGLWSRFNDVAQTNPHAWINDNFSALQIRTSSANNRAVSFPYTKLMNSNNAVDMGAALIICSVNKAKQLGIPENKWVYPHAGVEGCDHFSASVRDNFYSSPAIRLVGKRLFALARVNAVDLDFVDLYSCFPSAVQIAARELGLSEDSQLTVTGGLTFGGGPLNNYVMHSIASMVELLRESPGSKGLITANGGNLYKHAHGIYCSEAPQQDFKRDNVQNEIDALVSRECIPEFAGEVSIESYTVMYNQGEAAVGHFACLTADGRRVWVNTEDRDMMQAMSREEFCGKSAVISSRQELRLV